MCRANVFMGVGPTHSKTSASRFFCPNVNRKVGITFWWLMYMAGIVRCIHQNNPVLIKRKEVLLRNPRLTAYEPRNSHHHVGTKSSPGSNAPLAGSVLHHFFNTSHRIRSTRLRPLSHTLPARNAKPLDKTSSTYVARQVPPAPPSLPFRRAGAVCNLASFHFMFTRLPLPETKS